MTREPGSMQPTSAPSRPTDPKVPAEPDKAHAAKTREQLQESRWRLFVARDLIALGFVLILATATVVVVFLPAAEVINVMSPIVAMVGTLIGAAFGVQAGSQGRAEEAAGRAEANEKAVEAAALLDPARGEILLERWRDSSPRGNPPQESF